jgi:UDP-N-acetylglucosamine 2-epimerase (non-hydrolysing)
MKTTIHLICAARPNFMKIAPLYHALKKESWCQPKIVHTGQHYDYLLSDVFFKDLELPQPDYSLGVGSGSHAEQTANTMIAFENLCLNEDKPDLVIVVGDVNATMACAIVAKKLHLPVAHLEAGLRSFDRAMPEEINRIVTDSISDYYWTPSEDADKNLLNEGVGNSQIYTVGNIMIDTYCLLEEKIKQRSCYKDFSLQPSKYVVLTLHRPSNVDDIDILQRLMDVIVKVGLPIIFPAHPRTKKNLEKIKNLSHAIRIIEPLSYIDFMSMVSTSAYVISDSGGIQEETTYLGIPCFTLRNTTERPITVTMGSNQLVNIDNLLEKVANPKKGSIPPLWDGKTSTRIVSALKNILGVNYG